MKKILMEDMDMENDVMENDVTVSGAAKSGDRELKPIPESIEDRQKMIREDVLKGRAKIWKMSHSQKSEWLDKKERAILLNERLIAIHATVENRNDPKKDRQGYCFMEEMNIGDYFYLCHGNKENDSVILLGRVAGDWKDCTVLGIKKDWICRDYEVIIESIHSHKYDNKINPDKGWAPCRPNTLYKIKPDEFEDFGKKVLKSYFGFSLV
ncbi:MAG: hypothetical protein NC078_07505 [Ruminococcus sp.]|nr:hypothetical protein [Ruminococcus sp.]